MSMSPAEKLAGEKKAGPSKRQPVMVCRLKDLREALKLSKRDVARAIGMSSTCYGEAERGANIVLTNALAIAKFFGLPIEKIWRPPDQE
jgi:DNA-binding XRE family transcriptional regulator